MRRIRTWRTIPGGRRGAWAAGSWPGSHTRMGSRAPGAGGVAAAIRGHPPGARGRPLDDRHAGEEGERRLGDRDTSLAGLLVMPGGDDQREMEGRVLDHDVGQGNGYDDWQQTVVKHDGSWNQGCANGRRESMSGILGCDTWLSTIWTDVIVCQGRKKGWNPICETVRLCWTEIYHLKGSGTWSYRPLDLIRT